MSHQRNCGASFSGSLAPHKKSNQRQPKESLPNAGAASRRKSVQYARIPGNGLVVDPAHPDVLDHCRYPDE